ncbi:hypothetical protein [Streptomyces parvus]|uniref:Uncharacterized protein n=1 Tax=Streptomyces parvus TaxID=66428 RepID=A0A7K3S2U2_9ACTN|nr:hypothetical protein [Streptomyces parvus]NEC21825.1 hypothetical protein [Streptomyces parvus]
MTDIGHADEAALAIEVLEWEAPGSAWPKMCEARAAVDKLNSFGEQLRTDVRAAFTSGRQPPVLGEADRRLGLPLEPLLPMLPRTVASVVHRAQNLARLVQGLQRALDASSPVQNTATPRHRKGF